MFKLISLAVLGVVAFAQITPIPGGGGGGGGVGAANVTATSASAVTSLAIDISTLALSELSPLLVQCWSGTAAPYTPVTITSLNPATTSSVTANFTSTANVTCRANSSGGAGPTGPTGPQGPSGVGSAFSACEVVIGDPGAATPLLSDDNDAPAICFNVSGVVQTITEIACYANAGSPTVRPIITGGSATSLLSADLTCGTGSYATGTLSGTPTMATGSTIDANIASAGGVAKYIVIRITRRLN